MLSPGLTAEDCPNRETCGILTELTPEEEVELIRFRQAQAQQWQEELEQREAEAERVREVIRVNQRQAAAIMLLARGCTQTPESLGVTEALAQVESRLDQLRSQLSQYEGAYIAPTGCELHHYNVKRPWGTYEYNKLTAATPISVASPNSAFEPVICGRRLRSRAVGMSIRSICAYVRPE